MHLHRTIKFAGVGHELDPLLLLWVVLADRVAQRAVCPAGVTELGGQLAQQVFVAEVAAGLRDLVREYFRKREVLKKGDDIGEGLVKIQHVGVGSLHEVLVESIQ